ncbi:MAG: DUF1836 domain-containing protein [Evtepia sp.]
MLYHKEFVAEKLRKWETQLNSFALPTWEELPSIELYMDQVIVLLTQYLEFLSFEEEGEKAVTASAINNYVRTKIMPPPNKKKYGKMHLAYLVMICTLKQSMSIAYVQRMIPMGLSEAEVKLVYNDYVSRHKSASMFFIEQVNLTASKVFDPMDSTEYVVENMVSTVAVLSGLSKLLSEKILLLQDPILPEKVKKPVTQERKDES